MVNTDSGSKQSQGTGDKTEIRRVVRQKICPNSKHAAANGFSYAGQMS
jgi:hypothetical protein